MTKEVGSLALGRKGLGFGNGDSEGLNTEITKPCHEETLGSFFPMH
jgi:hypothetical protein